MFSNWFSGDDLEHYRRSPHKQRIDAIASSLLRLKYASEVIRQHLHECLRFSRTLDAKATAEQVRAVVGLREYLPDVEWRRDSIGGLASPLQMDWSLT
jgi:hypothetical protein